MKINTFDPGRIQRKLNFTILLVLLLIPTSALSGFAQAVRLEDKRISISKKDVAFGTVLGYLSTNYGLSFGVEVVPGEEESNDLRFAVSKPNHEVFIDKRTKFSLDLKDATLAEVMDSLTKQKPGYRWEISDGVINIFPGEGRDERLERLMDLKIATFVMEKEADLIVGKILDRIVASPEVKEFEKTHDLRIPAIHSVNVEALRRKMGRVRFDNLSLKQLLNKLALTKEGSWRVTLTTFSNPSSKLPVIKIEI